MYHFTHFFVHLKDIDVVNGTDTVFIEGYITVEGCPYHTSDNIVGGKHDNQQEDQGKDNLLSGKAVTL